MAVVVQRPAPAFTATAVVEGEFKEVSLSEYLGQWYVSYAPDIRERSG
jgi:peroxiredoxin (alkyl hydroperoxide reductase subunit C)